MAATIEESWQAEFLRVIQQRENAGPLKEAALRERLADWTRRLTDAAIATCDALGWQGSAKAHASDILPVPRGEYLGLDVIAFERSKGRWHFPIAVMELENSRNDDRIAYSLWKVLCVRAKLRVVFCYRRTADQRASLVRFLTEALVGAMDVQDRLTLPGSTVLVIGSRDDSETFPYGFFKWWRLDHNTGTFGVM